jgi:hypothetical protein
LTSPARPTRAAEAAYRLGGFLNGTHRGAHAARRNRSFSPRAAVETTRSVESIARGAGKPLVLGTEPWAPTSQDENRLRDSFAESLEVDGVLELVVFGSLARGSTTGFSDVDALLVVDDNVVVDHQALGRLRPNVLAAGRAALAYQPMQHHGFLVATPRLLAHPTALALPAEALTKTVSLFGRPLETFAGAAGSAAEAFRAHAKELQSLTAWPRHAWLLHRAVATFELAPVLYLQATGRPCAKHASFEIARADFPDSWSPYEVLDEVRRRWPRQQSPSLQRLARVLRNPWATSAVRRRLPAPVPRAVDELLDDRCFTDLQRLVGLMNENVR